MSGDSSSVGQPSQPGLRGPKAAVLSLLSVVVIYYVLPIIAALLVYWYAGVFLHMPHNEIVSWLGDSISAQFVFMLLAQGMTLVLLYVLLRRFRWSLRDIGLSKPKWIHPLIGVAAAVPYLLLYALLVTVVSNLVSGFDSQQAQDIGFHNVSGAAQLTMTFISLVVLPPLVEEITMRGFLYTGLRKWLPRIAAALVVSVLFGAAHLTEGGSAGPLWVGAIDTFALSMILIGLRELTGNLWAGITLHALKNGVAFVALFILTVR